MSLPTTQELERVIVAILSGARDEGRLSELTVRIVRHELATRFGVEEDVLNGETYKSFIKETVHATVESLRNASDGDAVEKPAQRKGGKKDKSAGTSKTGPRKRRSKVEVGASDEEAPEAANVPPSKKTSARSKTSKPSKGKLAKKPESETKYKSKATIESSDEEGGTPGSTKRKSPPPPKKQMSMSPSPKHKHQESRKGDSDVEMDTGEGPSSSSKAKRTSEPPKPSTSKVKELTNDPMESELSSVVDEPPKKRKKKEDKESVKPQKDEKAKRGKKEALSKDEETVNKLKSIVVACGVRKVWKKEFEGLDRPSQQIKRLHSILGELGMTPRYSVEKAKAIRERRELAQELKDVQDFEKAVKRRGKGHHNTSQTRESEDQNDSDDGDPPARKKHNARASIMAFLQDQSEEE